MEWTLHLQSLGIEFVFLTARHFDSMWPGTLSSLQKLKFPIHEKNLFLKKDLSVSDAVYKTKTLSQLLANAPEKKVWFIDNEPVVLNQIQQDHPKVQLVWFDSCHSGKMMPPKNTPSLSSFSF